MKGQSFLTIYKLMKWTIYNSPFIFYGNMINLNKNIFYEKNYSK